MTTEYLFTRLKVSKTYGVKPCMFDEDGITLYDKHVWSLLKSGRTFYLCRGIKVGNKKVLILFHRELMGLEPGEIYDHINGDGLCNMKSNLRPSTSSQNACNTRKHSNNTSGVKGLCYQKNEKVWRGDIQCDGKHFFKTSKDQQVIIDWLHTKREELHGVFANHG